MLKKVLLCLLCLALLLPAAHAETTLNLVVNPLWMSMDIFERMPVEVRESDDIMDDMANAFAMRNDQIDIFVFPAEEGLYAVKKHGYYAPLNDSKAFMSKLSDLYPAFQRALCTDDGELVGWVLGGCVMCMSLRDDVLEEVGLTAPTTFDELLDCCQAILDADALPAGIALFNETPFTRQAMLDLYMDQYIRASQLEGGVVDFTNPAFAAMAERISAELTDIDPVWENGWPDDGVFNYPVGYDVISRDMLPMPQILADRAGLIDVYPSIAVVNPYSAHREEAIAFLERFTQWRMESYLFDTTLTEPIKGKWLLEEIGEVDGAIAALEAVADPTPEQRDELEELRLRRNSLEDSWTISPADIEAYARLSGGLSITEASPVTYDAALRTAAQRFLNDAFDAQGFARECQDHIVMIYQENGIPMN